MSDPDPDGILSERLQASSDAEDCPVQWLCQMHRAAVQWLDAGDTDALRAHMDVFRVLHRRVWRTCLCDLFTRIRAVVIAPHAD